MIFNFSKYYQIFKISFESYLVYRTNFVIWRVRNVILFIAVYFFWEAVFANNLDLYGYNRAEILTYVFISQMLRSWIFTTRTEDMIEDITSGDLGNALIKPVSYFKLTLTKEIADKLLNIGLNIIEIVFIYLVFKPPLVWPQQAQTYVFFALVIVLALSLNYLLTYLISLLTFWFRENGGWPIRFFYSMLFYFLTGGFFPLDILPPAVFSLLLWLPSTYIIFMPIQIWLEKVGTREILFTIAILLVWMVIIKLIINWTWRKGLRFYESEGR